MRPTSGPERLSQEIKRWVRVMRIFFSRESCLRLVTDLAGEQSEEWLTDKRYLNLEKVREHRYEKREAEAVAIMKR